jgi:hypothetical protein
VGAACSYFLDHNFSRAGQFSSTAAPSGTIDCLQGNMCWALLALGCHDPRLEQAFDWLARTVTGEGISPLEDKQALTRYYAYKCGPGFACGANNSQPCAWGGAKVMLALGKLPVARRTRLVERAIERGAAFFLGVDPATAAYPNGWSDKPNGAWWKFGFPVFYITDILQIAEALAALGYGRDPRLTNTVQLIRAKQDATGGWLQEYSYGDKTWVDFGAKRQPSKWVTIRALRVLKAC